MNKLVRISLCAFALICSAKAIAAGFTVEGYGGGFPEERVEMILNADGKTASAVVSVPKIPLSASVHSPHCSNGRWTVAGVPVAGNRESECRRYVLVPPAGYETNAAAGTTGVLSHAWSAFFNPQWFADTKLSAIFVKNWSAHEEVIATITISVCPAGAGCANAAAPVPISPPRQEIRRERERDFPRLFRMPV